MNKANASYPLFLAKFLYYTYFPVVIKGFREYENIQYICH